MSVPAVEAAVAALTAGRKAEALARLEALGPDVADDPLGLQAWAVSLEDPGAAAEALALLERAVRIAPGDAQAHFNLAVRLQRLGELPRAIAHYEHALRLAPAHTGALNNLSDLMRRRGRAEEGWALMQRYLAADASPAGLEVRLAKLALETHRFTESETWFQAAHRAQPGDRRIDFEHAMLALALGQYGRGWPMYEARLDVFGPAGLAMFPYQLPAWDGAARPGQPVLLHREQGLGDMIMFASAAPGLLEEGAELHLAMPPALVRLFCESFPRARVWPSVTVARAPRQPDQPFLKACGPLAAQAPMASLGALRMLSGPPAPEAYLKPPPAEIGRWKGRLEALAPPRAGERRIGLVIGARLPRFSDDGLANGLRKSVPAADLEPLADVTRVRWFSLHDRASSAQLADVPRLPIVDLSPWITDFADTAAAIANLDAVVSVDTAVAHLAGAMDKPLFVLLWRNADWRWGVERTDSPWRPHATLLRQRRAGRWGEPIEALAAALA